MVDKLKNVGLAVVMCFALFGVQSSPASSPKQDTALAVNVLRAINTAEYNYKQNHSSYAPWDVLVTSSEFVKNGLPWAVSQEPELSKIEFSAKPDVLPGWTLRILISTDSKHYDVSLERTSDKCNYAVWSDERGLIRESKTIECEK